MRPAKLGVVLVVSVCWSLAGAQQQAATVAPEIEQAIVGGDWEKVAELGGAWQQREPNSPLAGYVAADAYTRLNQGTRAFRACIPLWAAVSEDPESAWPLAAWARDFAQRHPRLSAAWSILASVLLYTDRYDAAVEAGDRAVSLDPADPVAYYNRGWAYYWVDDYDRATADLEKALELQPDSAEITSALADIYMSVPDYGKALGLYDRAIELDAGYPDAYYGRGALHHYQAEYDQAIADYSRFIELEKGYSWAYEMRGIAYYRTRQYDRALEDFTRAVEIYPWEAYLRLYQARAYRRLGRTQEAVQALRKFIELAPGRGEAWRIPEARAMLAELGAGE